VIIQTPGDKVKKMKVEEMVKMKNEDFEKLNKVDQDFILKEVRQVTNSMMFMSK